MPRDGAIAFGDLIRVRPFIEKRYRRDVEHARARALYRFRSGQLAGPAIQNNNPD